MPCTPDTQPCTPIPSSILKLAGLGHNSRCLIPIQPGPPGTALVVAPDQKSFCWLPMHHPARLTSNKAPFEWSSEHQCGNIPLMSVVKNADGSITIDPGDGKPAVTIPPDCCPTLVKNLDGSFTFTHGDGSQVVIPNRACILGDCQSINGPFKCGATLTQNQPNTYTFTNPDGSTITFTTGGPSSTLKANPDGSYTFTNPDGSTVTFTPGGPGGPGPNHPALTLTNNQDLTTADPRASLNASAQILNLPPVIFAHRRHARQQGAAAIPGVLWSPISLSGTTPGVSLIRDTTNGQMIQPVTSGIGGIRIPRTGYYEVRGTVSFHIRMDAIAHGAAIYADANILQTTFIPDVSAKPSEPTVIYSGPFTTGQIIQLYGHTSATFGNLYASADLTVRWICD